MVARFHVPGDEGPRHHEPDPSRDLNDKSESEGGLVGHFGIVSGIREPLLHHETGHVLHDERGCDVEQV